MTTSSEPRFDVKWPDRLASASLVFAVIAAVFAAISVVTALLSFVS